MTKPNTITLKNGMEFLYIPAGKFVMGSDHGDAQEKPAHTVIIPHDYWMARYPVTNIQYSQYVEKYSDKEKDHPVVGISWIDGLEYCHWLTRSFKSMLPERMVVRLPTEAEWEKAARGIDEREYPWGNEFDKGKCNSVESGKKGTTPVGFYSPQGDSPYGCADMAGNIWEWTHSKNERYPYSFNDGREDEQNRSYVVARGGSFDNNQKDVRCFLRAFRDPNFYNNYFGLRVVVAPYL